MQCPLQAAQAGGQPLHTVRGHLAGGGVDHCALGGGGNYLDGHVRVAGLGAFWKVCNGRAHWREKRVGQHKCSSLRIKKCFVF